MSNTKKSLLNENTIRRFMKLAEIDKLSDGFVDGLQQEVVGLAGRAITGAARRGQTGGSESDGKKTVKEQEDFGGDPAGPDSGESGLGDLTPDDMDMAAAEEPDEASELTAAVSNLMGVISSMTGVDIDVDGGDDEEVELDVEDEDVMQETAGASAVRRGLRGVGSTAAQSAAQSAGQPPRGKEGQGTQQPMSQEIASDLGAQRSGKLKGTRGTATHQESLQRAANYRHALKQEVLRRVQGRIHQERRNDAVADQLSERILQRIKNRR